MVTQKDIARKVGVSVTLVSRVLSGKWREIGVAAATARTIEKAASELRYVPNATAHVLRGAPSQTLGVVVYDFEDPFLGAIIGALHRLAREHDHSLVLAGFEHRREDAQALRPLVKHGLSGLVVVGSGLGDDWLETFRALRIPLARIGSGGLGDRATVSIDNADGVGKLLAHLAERDYRTAGFLSDTHPAHRERLRLFRDLQWRHGIASRPEWEVALADPAAPGGLDPLRALLSRPSGERPRALLAAGDGLALRALRACRDVGLRVPEDLAVGGFDDIPFAAWSAPALTTIRQPVAAMVRTAFEWVTGAAVAQEQDALRGVLLQGALQVREST